MLKSQELDSGEHNQKLEDNVAMEIEMCQDEEVVRAFDNERPPGKGLGRGPHRTTGWHWKNKDDRNFAAHCMASQRELDVSQRTSRFQTPMFQEVF